METVSWHWIHIQKTWTRSTKIRNKEWGALFGTFSAATHDHSSHVSCMLLLEPEFPGIQLLEGFIIEDCLPEDSLFVSRSLYEPWTRLSGAPCFLQMIRDSAWTLIFGVPSYAWDMIPSLPHEGKGSLQWWWRCNGLSRHYVRPSMSLTKGCYEWYEVLRADLKLVCSTFQGAIGSRFLLMDNNARTYRARRGLTITWNVRIFVAWIVQPDILTLTL